MIPDRIVFSDPTGERVSFKKLNGTDVTGDMNNVFESHLGKPVTVLANLDLVKVDNGRNLIFPFLKIEKKMRSRSMERMIT